jgi:cell migration-inducing and hyaluronan-binding protein
MIMAGGSAQVDGVEFRRMGQFNKLGRYPFHWHLLGDAPGQSLRNSSIHSSFQRGVVIHGTRQTLVENNVVFDTPGHNYSIEDSTATDNLLHSNLALENRVISLTEATLREQGDNQAANFWIRSARFILPSSNLALPPPLSPRSRSRR